MRQREENGLHEVLYPQLRSVWSKWPAACPYDRVRRERIHHHQDTSLSAFADLFHHRLTLLFYRAWADAQPAVSLDRADNKRFEGYRILDRHGPAGADDQRQPERTCPFYSRRTPDSRHARDPEGLEKILRNYFNAPVKLVTNVAQWMPLSPREQAQLGEGRRLPRMGESAFLGVAVRDVQHKFRIEIGPRARKNTTASCQAKRGSLNCATGYASTQG